MSKVSCCGPSEAQEKRWRAESDMRTLAEAEDIRKDPKRLAAAKAMAKEKLAELQKVVGQEGVKK